MKKLAITLAIVLGITLGATAQKGGGLFQHGPVSEEEYYGSGNNRTGFLELPGSHGGTQDVDGAPLGSGIALLLGLGGAYLVAKKRKEE